MAKSNKTSKKLRKAALPTIGNGSKSKSPVKVDDGADLAKLVQTAVAPSARPTIDWDDEDEEIDIKTNPVIKQAAPKKETPKAEQKQAPKPVVKKEEKIDYSQYIAKRGSGRVTEVTEKYAKINTINPATDSNVTILAYLAKGLEIGNIVNFQFSVHMGKLSAVNVEKIGNDEVLTKLRQEHLEVLEVVFASDLKSEDLPRVKGVSADSKFVVLCSE